MRPCGADVSRRSRRCDDDRDSSLGRTERGCLAQEWRCRQGCARDRAKDSGRAPEDGGDLMKPEEYFSLTGRRPCDFDCRIPRSRHSPVPTQS